MSVTWSTFDMMLVARSKGIKLVPISLEYLSVVYFGELEFWVHQFLVFMYLHAQSIGQGFFWDMYLATLTYREQGKAE